MAKYSFDELREIIKTLRSENGCPWDREQTHESLKPCMIEEAAELAASIRIYKETGDDTNLCEELGDVLLQVFLHSQIAQDENRFTIDDVIDGISEKMIRRHPHVFGQAKIDTSGQVLEQWEDIKKKEKENQSYKTTPLKEIPLELPALMRAQKVLKKADGIYHISQDKAETIENIRQKINKLEVQSVQGDESTSEQIGALLLACANLARVSKIDSEEALTDQLEKLIGSIEDEKNVVNKKLQ